MYSYEERMRAVELYIRLGKRAWVTICELGYPTKNALRGWYRDYEGQQVLPPGSAPRPPKFSEAQGQIALQHYAIHGAIHGRCISGTIQALGFPGRATLTVWVRDAFGGTKTVTVGGRGCGTYSDAVKRAGVVRLYSRQETAQTLAEKFGVSRPTLYNWKNQLLGPEAPATLKRKNTAPSGCNHPIGTACLSLGL